MALEERDKRWERLTLSILRKGEQIVIHDVELISLRWQRTQVVAWQIRGVEIVVADGDHRAALRNGNGGKKDLVAYSTYAAYRVPVRGRERGEEETRVLERNEEKD